MPNLTLDKQHTALLIADFYAEAVGTLPHAADRQVVASQEVVRALAG